MKLTYRYRVKNHLGLLNRQARAVNFVWNFCNDRQKDALKWDRKWPTGFDLQKLCAGAGKELGLLSNSIAKVCERYVDSRFQNRKPYLRYRGRRSLGWMPFRAVNIRQRGEDFWLGGNTFRVFYSRPIPEGAKFCDGGSFSQDARGNWYLNIVLDVPEPDQREVRSSVGIDLGLKDFATLSTGEKIANPRHYAAAQERLARAQRARKKRQAAKIHAGIQNARRDALHKLSHRLVRQFDHIVIGRVDGLAKTSMAKSVLDASWYSFRQMLAYKSNANGARYEEVDERFTSRLCSECGSLGGPKGIAEVGIRQWTCADCGAIHDRDVNAAQNILARSGHRSLAEGVQV